MSGGLSQDEINALLNASVSDSEPPKKPKRKKKNIEIETIVENTELEIEDTVPESIVLSDIDIDVLGEVGNISMGSASTALSNMIAKKVNITTPIVSVTTLSKMRAGFDIPNIALEIKYVSGIVGKNVLIMKITDAAVIANLMMGGDGYTTIDTLSEIEESAVSEAMNQMMGSAATAMATMFAREVNISPPKSKIWDSMTPNLSEEILEDEAIVQVAFKLNIEGLVDSVIMQVLSLETVQKIVSIMMGTEVLDTPVSINCSDAETTSIVIESNQESVEKIKAQAFTVNDPVPKENASTPPVPSASNYDSSEYAIQKIGYKQFSDSGMISKNTSSVFDVPLNIQIVLGNAQRSIKEILNFGNGTLLELNQLADQPVELHVNGKIIAYGEVVTVNDNLGIRILDINKNNI